jgi:translation elongation factor P/translation initiation factor 5A
MVLASELKSGLVLRIDGEIYRVLQVEVKAGAAKLGGVVKAQLNNLITGSMWERHFRPQERLEEVELQQQAMEFLFSDGESCTFMNPENYEQVEVPRAMIGVAEKFLQRWKTGLRFSCRSSLAPGKSCAWTWRQAGTWNGHALSASGAHNAGSTTQGNGQISPSRMQSGSRLDPVEALRLQVSGSPR